MRPDFAATDQSDERIGNAKLAPAFCFGPFEIPDAKYLRFGQFSVPVALTFGSAPRAKARASFADLVRHVVGIGAEK